MGLGTGVAAREALTSRNLARPQIEPCTWHHPISGVHSVSFLPNGAAGSARLLVSINWVHWGLARCPTVSGAALAASLAGTSGRVTSRGCAVSAVLLAGLTQRLSFRRSDMAIVLATYQQQHSSVVAVSVLCLALGWSKLRYRHEIINVPNRDSSVARLEIVMERSGSGRRRVQRLGSDTARLSSDCESWPCSD